MVLLYISAVIAGTFLTIWGSYKLSEEWSKKDILRQTHITPEVFLFDCEIEAKLEENLKNDILKNCLSKISGQGKMETLILSPFFDQTGYEKNKIAKKNYSLDSEIYNNFTSFDIFCSAVSKDNSIILDLTKEDKCIMLSADTETKESTIEIRNYNSLTDKFKIYYRNIKLDVNSKTISQFVTDLNNGDFTLNVITEPKLNIVKVNNAYLKTKMSKYFKITDFKVDNLGRNIGKINLLLN